MSDIRVVLLLLVLSPALGLAQSAEPVSPPLVQVEDAPPAEALAPLEGAALGLDVSVTQAVEPRPPVPRAGRVFTETLVGGLGGVGGSFAGLLGGVFLTGGSSCAGDCRPTGAIGGMLMGFSLGAATGVYASGRMMGGRGQLLPTLTAGLLSGGAVTLLYANDGVGEGGAAALLLLPLVSSVVTYELTSSWSSPAEPAPGNTGAWWAPTVGVSGQGAALGLTGRF